ncbi:hypothetical protein O181_044944 [Austropuccinia psidii MF-1]|uniref:Uncharacterized protein n=1 Tax=Austropuccinia psidii MF-1 TaxID=1389203 RepID=A0A9Q3DL83_9BASI|nr:hypothetical protein [Austropuccinia psidii MF-1]
MAQTDERQAYQTGLEFVLQYLGVPPQEQEHFQYHQIPPSTDFSSSSSPSSPGPLKMVLEVPGTPPTTPENEFYLLGPIPSFLDGAAPSMRGPLSNWALS